MDRTNISILLATALLGVLLYVVRQFGNTGLDAVTPPARAPDPRAAAADSTRVIAAPETTAAELPVVDGLITLRALLDTVGLDADAVIDATRRWYEARGFIGANPLFGADPESTLRNYYASLDQATLLAMSDNNELGATHELAARARLNDPFAALDLLRRASRQGSVNALLQMASLEETLADVRPEDFATDRDYAKNLSRVGGRNNEANLRYRAFTSAATALRDGGAPVVDRAMLDWVDAMAGRIPAPMVRSACNQSFASFLNLSAARRSLGRSPMNLTPPPVFLAVPDLQERMPCKDTVNPIVSSIELDACAATEVLDGRGALRLLYVCTGN